MPCNIPGSTWSFGQYWFDFLLTSKTRARGKADPESIPEVRYTHAPLLLKFLLYEIVKVNAVHECVHQTCQKQHVHITKLQLQLSEVGFYSCHACQHIEIKDDH